MDKKQKYILYKFISFVKKELGITDPFKIKLSSDRSEFKTYAYYDPNKKLAAVYTKGRAIGDIMRSVCHELVHHKQNQNKEIKPGKDIPDIGGKIEDDANSIAGQLIKKFGYQYPKLSIWNTN